MDTHPPIVRVGLLATLTLFLAEPALAQATSQQTNRELKRTGLATEALAGQVVGVLPITHISRDTALRDSLIMGPRATVMHWADSVLGESLIGQTPEINWMLPPELRMASRKAAGMVPEPDRMGQSVMRSPRLDQVPDPLRGYLRTLMGIAGGRFVFIPASITAGKDSVGAIRLTLMAVLADTRTGKVVWRASNAFGTGRTPADALLAAVKTFLPDADSP